VIRFGSFWYFVKQVAKKRWLLIIGGRNQRFDCIFLYKHCPFSTPSCDHFGRHSEWKKYLVTKILAKVANWRPTELRRNLLENYQKYLTNLINSTSGGITCLSLFPPLVVQKVECVNLK